MSPQGGSGPLDLNTMAASKNHLKDPNGKCTRETGLAVDTIFDITSAACSRICKTAWGVVVGEAWGTGVSKLYGGNDYLPGLEIFGGSGLCCAAFFYSFTKSSITDEAFFNASSCRWA